MSAYVHDLFQIDMTRAAARVDGLVPINLVVLSCNLSTMILDHEETLA
jgi:hypothetical protein